MTSSSTGVGITRRDAGLDRCGPFWVWDPTWATGAGYLRAVAGLPDVVAVSPVYETEPVGGPAGQDHYLNVVVELDTELSPRELLEVGPPAGRGRRPGARTVRFGPRTLDVDVLLVGDLPWSTRTTWWCPIPGCGSAGSWSSHWPSWHPSSVA